MQGVIVKAKKLPKQQPEFKAEVEAFEERLLATAVERKEEEATTEVLCLSSRVPTSEISKAAVRRAAMPMLHPAILYSLPVHMLMEVITFSSHRTWCPAQPCTCLSLCSAPEAKNHCCHLQHLGAI